LTVTRYYADPTNTDVLFPAASGNPALDNEDYRPDTLFNDPCRGFPNRLEGHISNIAFGARFSTVTQRGNRVSTHKTRERFVLRDTATGERNVNKVSARDDLNNQIGGML
jgi:hypothetical protein